MALCRLPERQDSPALRADLYSTVATCPGLSQVRGVRKICLQSVRPFAGNHCEIECDCTQFSLSKVDHHGSLPALEWKRGLGADLLLQSVTSASSSLADCYARVDLADTAAGIKGRNIGLKLAGLRPTQD